MRVGSLIKYKHGSVSHFAAGKNDVGIIVEHEASYYMVRVKWSRLNIPTPVWERSGDLEVISE